MLHAVIMSGGSGTRFWPLSRRDRPKQLLPLAGERTLIQQTVDRCASLIPAERTWVVTNQAQLKQTARQLPDVPRDNFLVEPCGRNTAPCVGLAAIALLRNDPDAVMLVLPADHVVRPIDAFQNAVAEAVKIIEGHPEGLLLFGVAPTYPATGFGYIERGRPLAECGIPAYHVDSFREKPQADVAAEYVREARYFWNCGIFVWRADRILQALQEYEPDVHAGLLRLQTAIGGRKWKQTLAAEFPNMRSISIDYAVLERARNVYVVQAPFEWDDLGSWQAVPRQKPGDADGNTVTGPFCGIDTSGCVIQSDEGHLIAAIGLKDVIIVHTPDATLVADKNDAEAMRKLIARLGDNGYERFL